MKTGHLLRTTFFAGILSITVGACGNSGLGSGGSGGTTTPAGSSGGSPATGGSASGGTSSSVATTATQPGTGGTSSSVATTAAGGSKGTGGTQATAGAGIGGRSASGGRSVQETGGTVVSGGVVGTGTALTGGLTGATGGARVGGTTAAGGRSDTTGPGGAGGTGTIATTGPRAGSTGSTGSTGSGTCTASKEASRTVTGSGPHKVVIETNSAAGIKCGTIFRPSDLGAGKKYPILVWGEGGCSQDGLSNVAAMGEIASQGYFIVADGVPSGTACAGGQDGKAFLDYITWAIAENDKSCSAYYQSLDTTKIAADGFSCGGLMAENVSGDPRFTAIGITSSGQMGSNKALYDKIHTPFKIMNGGSNDMAYTNGLNDYTEISSRKIPILYFSKSSAGHGGDLGSARGDFNTVNLAWLNWQLKGDEGATGKGLLMGASCKYCTASGWEFKSANIP